MQKKGYKRVLLKLSGEALKGESPGVIDDITSMQVAESICEVVSFGVQVGVVIGGGNIFRGSQAKLFGLPRTPADHIGMLATAINGLILGQLLEAKGCKAQVLSTLYFGGMIEPYHWGYARRLLDKGVIVIFVGGTGSPYFTTDTAAAVRASEIGAEVLLKGTKVDGVYDKDPLKFSDAKKRDHLTFTEVLQENLEVMDETAVVLCRDNNIPIHVFNLFSKGVLKKIVCEKRGGTIVSGE